MIQGALYYTVRGPENENNQIYFYRTGLVQILYKCQISHKKDLEIYSLNKRRP